MSEVILDIETGPMTKEYLDMIKPNFKATRAKKPEKVAEEIAEKEEAFYDNAALCPTTGRVLAIGLRITDNNGATETLLFSTGDEAADLESFWSLWRGQHSKYGVTRGDRIIGFNVLDFDIPFLVNRGWINGIQVPYAFRDVTYLERKEMIRDVMLMWNCGRFKRSFKSLQSLAVALGVGNKKRENSELFFKLWESDKEAALSHLRNDLIITEAVYQRIQMFTHDQYSTAGN